MGSRYQCPARVATVLKMKGQLMAKTPAEYIATVDDKRRSVRRRPGWRCGFVGIPTRRNSEP
jgi:hypothetical protein